MNGTFQDEVSSGDLLAEGLGALGLLEDKTLSLLRKYIGEIELFNPAYGLVKVRDRRELIVKHVFDSLAPLHVIHRIISRGAAVHGSAPGGPAACAADKYAPSDKTPLIADAGSGAGLPGIPLAVCMPGADFTLIERMGRRAGFLRNALAVLGLPNVRVEEAEMEKLSASPSLRFDVIVFRAFRPLEPAILKGLLRLLAPGGALAAYKGRKKSIEEEMTGVLDAAQKGAGPSLGAWEMIPLEVPFLDEERHLLLIEPRR